MARPGRPPSPPPPLTCPASCLPGGGRCGWGIGAACGRWVKVLCCPRGGTRGGVTGPGAALLAGEPVGGAASWRPASGLTHPDHSRVQGWRQPVLCRAGSMVTRQGGSRPECTQVDAPITRHMARRGRAWPGSAQACLRIPTKYPAGPHELFRRAPHQNASSLARRHRLGLNPPLLPLCSLRLRPEVGPGCPQL